MHQIEICRIKAALSSKGLRYNLKIVVVIHGFFRYLIHIYVLRIFKSHNFNGYIFKLETF